MIGRLQRVRLLNQAAAEKLQAGRFPSAGDLIARVTGRLKGRRFGAPLTQFRPAVTGQPIGGAQGNDIELTFTELLDDLKLLFAAQIELAARATDLYDIFATRRDRLTLKLQQVRLAAQTALAQQAAASRSSVTESFHTLENINLGTTTAQIDLAEGTCTLPTDQTATVRYDGSKARVIQVSLPPGGHERGHTFEGVFSPYRIDAWYATIPVGGVVTIPVSVTGADYTRGDADEVTLNAIAIEPTGPLHVRIDWSPDGENWHDLSPAPNVTIRDRATFHFDPVTVGFLRFHLSHSEAVVAGSPDQQKPIGVKRIELLQKGFSSTASLYSAEYRFSEAVHTVVAQLDQATPVGTRITSYVAQSADGPWTQLLGGPVTFDTVQWQEIPVTTLTEEQPGVPATMWEAGIPIGSQPLPNTGELVAGRGQVQLAAFPFDWRQLGDRDHVLEETDWNRGLGLIRSGVFVPAGALGTLSTSGFTDARNPLGTDDRFAPDSFMLLALVQDGGQFVLQPGYNYRLRAYLWCSAPVTLEKQKIGVVNPSAYGGSTGVKVAPVSVFVNNVRVYQNQVATTDANLLSGASYLASLPLIQGWNSLDILVQVPADLVTGQNGLATQSVYLYIEPNLFAQNLSQNLKIDYIQAWQDPWKRVTEFDLRYSTALGNREAWAFRHDNATDTTDALLLNFDPTNSAGQDVLHPSYTTLDGISAGYPINLLLRYPVEIPSIVDQRALYFRADFAMDTGASAPPVLTGYTIIVN